LKCVKYPIRCHPSGYQSWSFGLMPWWLSKNSESKL
jgi:hypothetical protein